MHVYTYIHIYTCIHIYICTYIHIYIYTYYIHIYIYTYTHTHIHIHTRVHIQARPASCPARSWRAAPRTRKGTDGVSANGDTANVIYCDRGDFGVPICQNLSISRTFFGNLSKFITFTATPLVSTSVQWKQGVVIYDVTF